MKITNNFFKEIESGAPNLRPVINSAIAISLILQINNLALNVLAESIALTLFLPQVTAITCYHLFPLAIFYLSLYANIFFRHITAGIFNPLNEQIIKDINGHLKPIDAYSIAP